MKTVLALTAILASKMSSLLKTGKDNCYIMLMTAATVYK